MMKDVGNSRINLTLKEMWCLESVCYYDILSLSSFKNERHMPTNIFTSLGKNPGEVFVYAFLEPFFPLVIQISNLCKRMDDLYDIVKFEGNLDAITEELEIIESDANLIEDLIKSLESVTDHNGTENKSEKHFKIHYPVSELFKNTLLIMLNISVRRHQGQVPSVRLLCLKNLQILEVLVTRTNLRGLLKFPIFVISLISTARRAKFRILKMLRFLGNSRSAIELISTIGELWNNNLKINDNLNWMEILDRFIVSISFG